MLLSFPLKSCLFDFSTLKGTKILQRAVLCMQKHFFFSGSYEDLLCLEYFIFVMFLQRRFFIVTIPYFRVITKHRRLAKTSSDHLMELPLLKAGSVRIGQDTCLARAWISRSSLGNLCWYLTTFTGKKYFIFKINFLYFNLCLSSLILSLGNAEKCPASSFFTFPHQIFIYIMRSSWDFSSPSWALQASSTWASYERCFRPLMIFVALCWIFLQYVKLLVVSRSPSLDPALQMCLTRAE